MHRTQIYIEDDLFEKIKQISANLNISMSEFIRNSLRKELSQESQTDMEEFFDSFTPLQSFEGIEPSQYVNDIRSKSRILEK